MNEHDPHRIFLCDLEGRLITRGVSSDTVTLSGDDLRLSPPDLPLRSLTPSPIRS